MKKKVELQDSYRGLFPELLSQHAHPPAHDLKAPILPPSSPRGSCTGLPSWCVSGDSTSMSEMALEVQVTVNVLTKNPHLVVQPTINLLPECRWCWANKCEFQMQGMCCAPNTSSESQISDVFFKMCSEHELFLPKITFILFILEEQDVLSCPEGIRRKWELWGSYMVWATILLD